jgi:hypothetical protein
MLVHFRKLVLKFRGALYNLKMYRSIMKSSVIHFCGLYYKHVMIVIYDHNDSVQYHKTTITIVIDDP